MDDELLNKISIFRYIFQKMHLIRIEMHRECEITSPEFEMMLAIYLSQRRNEDFSASKLSEYFGVTLGGVMHTLASLEKKGYLIKEEDANDKRVKKFVLQDKAMRFLDKHAHEEEETIGKIFSFLGKRDTDELLRILYRIVKNKESWKK